MSKESVPPQERLAYHEAGHALMAINKRIEVFELMIPNRALRPPIKVWHFSLWGTWHPITGQMPAVP